MSIGNVVETIGFQQGHPSLSHTTCGWRPDRDADEAPLLPGGVSIRPAHICDYGTVAGLWLPRWTLERCRDILVPESPGIPDARNRLLFTSRLDHHVRRTSQPLRDCPDVFRVVLRASVCRAV